MSRSKLTDEAVEWAYEKWLEGFSKVEIARALGCTEKTLCNRFAIGGFIKQKPPLRLPKDLRVWEAV